MKTCIIVNLRVEGLHRWPDAAEVEPDVSFLAYPHRHEFHIKVKKTVDHDDRDIEIIMFKREIEMYLIETYLNDENLNMCDFGAHSCESLAREIFNVFNCDSVEVLEDGENGAEVSF